MNNIIKAAVDAAIKARQESNRAEQNRADRQWELDNDECGYNCWKKAEDAAKAARQIAEQKMVDVARAIEKAAEED
jgi:hypothetical protein